MALPPQICGSIRPRAIAPCPHRPPTVRIAPHARDGRPAAPRVASRDAPPQPAAEMPACLSEAARTAACGSAAGDQIREVVADLKGAIPTWLDGTFFINGPSYIKEMKHMFDGYATVQKWRIATGKVWSSHKHLETVAYKAYRETGQMKFSEFGTHLPGDGIGRKLKDIWAMMKSVIGLQAYTDNACVNIIYAGNGKMLAASEPKISHYYVDPSTLELQSRPLVDSKVKEDVVTAHPSKLSNGDFINVGTKLGSKYVIQRTNAKTGECTTVRSIPVRRPGTTSWIHDFPATDDYVVIMEQPAYFNLASFLFGKPAGCVAFDWAHEDGTSIHIVPLDPSKEVRSFSVPSCFILHFGNAFLSEDGKRLCFDGCRYESAEILNDFLLDNMRGGINDIAHSSLWRYELPLDGHESGDDLGRCLVPSITSFEMPTYNKEYKGKRNRFTYGISTVRPTSASNALCKIDAEAGSFTLWHEPGCSPAEPHFIPHPSGEDEDDGIVLSSVIGSDGLSFLLFLDGKTFKEVARARLPYSMSFRFHGVFVPSKAA